MIQPLLRMFALAAGAALVVAAQSKPAKPDPADSQTPTFGTNVKVVIAPTTVTDSRGKVVNGLNPHDFRLFDNEKLQAITEDIGFQPLSIVVCIQTSSHMTNALPKIQKIGPLLKDLILGQDGEAALIGFDHRVQRLQEFTNDGEKLTAALEKLRPGSMNNRLIDAIGDAARMLQYKKDRRKVIFLISETVDRSSETPLREVADKLQFENIDVYTLNVNRLVSSLTARPAYPRPSSIPTTARRMPNGQAADPTTVAQFTGAPGYSAEFIPIVTEMFRAAKGIFVDNPAELLTKFTGGRERSFTTQADIERVLTEIGEELHTQYLLSYKPSNKMEGGFHTIRVEVLRPGLKIRTRPGYWMAAVKD